MLTPSNVGDNNKSNGIKYILAKNWSYHSCATVMIWSSLLS